MDQCEATLATQVFSHYAYGYPTPCDAMFIGEDGPVEKSDGIMVYVRCEREAGHTGKHLARETRGWTTSEREQAGE